MSSRRSLLTLPLALAMALGTAHAVPYPGEVNGDGTVDFADLQAHSAANPSTTVLTDIVRAWGTTALPSAVTVPVFAWGPAVTGSASLNVTTPAGAVDDKLVLVVTTRSGADIQDPSGWTVAYEQAAGGVVTAVYTRTATQSASGTVAVSITSGNSSTAVVGRTAPGVALVDMDRGTDTSLGTSYSATAAVGVMLEQRDLLVAATSYNNDATAFSANLTENGAAAIGAVSHPIKANNLTGSDIHLTISQAEATTAGFTVPTVAGAYTGDAYGGTGETLFLVFRSGSSTGGGEEPPTGTNPGPLTADGGRPFAANGPWNTPLPANPALDPNSAAMVASTAALGATGNFYDFGDPVYTANSSDPLHTVDCTEPWGTCEPEATGVRMPTNAQPNAGSDGRIIVVDLVAQKSCDFWQATRTGTTSIRTSWATCVPLNDVDAVGPQGGATGADINALAGVIRTFEARKAAAGDINAILHALSFATGNSCGPNGSDNYRYPAAKTDGESTRSDCVPEGARFQLDPSIDVANLPNATPLEKAVARALQVYGGYNRDNCGANLCLSFENPLGEADPYPAAGVPNDYWHMPHIPWHRLRVVAESVTQP